MVGDFVNFVLSNNHDESNQVEIIYKKQIYRISDSKLSQIRNNLFDKTRYKWVEINFNTWEIKDYGWQISWRKVYVIEYLFALITFPYMVNNFWRIDVLLWIIHYMKRLYESIYIHKFSAQTMPLKNLYKNTLQIRYPHIIFFVNFNVKKYQPGFSKRDFNIVENLT